MKRYFIYLLPLLMACVAAGCSTDKVAKTTPIPTPTGTFGGFFQLVHTKVSTGANDSVRTNLTLVLDAQGNFTVTGDTSTLHAGSTGKFSLGVGDDLFFTDKTYPTAGVPAKVHLNGDYRYQYNGSVLGLDKNVGDSLSYQYYFTKASN
jgi:hypothetical protein